MLGQLLAFSVGVRPIAEALAFYRSLGFGELEVGDLTKEPRAVVWDGSIAIGLHDTELAGPAPTFVRPDLADYLRPLRRAGIEFESVQLGEDRFNEAIFVDPSGLRVVLLEARTHALADRRNAPRVDCGTFLELSVGTRSIETSSAFWSLLGLTQIDAGDTPDPWIRMHGHGLTVGFHQCAGLDVGLCYRATKFDARLAFLEAKGIVPARGSPLTAGPADSATLTSPGGTRIFMVADES